jgi:hypothetical protein
MAGPRDATVGDSDDAELAGGEEDVHAARRTAAATATIAARPRPNIGLMLRLDRRSWAG